MNHKTHSSRTIGFAVAACALALLAGCGSKLDGTYSGTMVDWEFKSGKKVNMNTLGGKIELDYEISGKEVKIKTPEGVLLATIGNDGCLDFGGMMGKACKEKRKK